MTKNIYCVQDLKSNFSSVFVEDGDSIAMRNFHAACVQPDSMFFRFPNDFRLFRIGEFDTETGVIDGYPESGFVLVCSADEFVKGGND